MDHERARGHGVELLQARVSFVGPPRLVEPQQHDGPLPRRGSRPGQCEQRGCGVGLLDVAVGERGAGGREVDVRVDESGQDRGAGKVHHPVRLRRVAAPHTLDMAVVDQHPLAGLRIRQGVHARRAIEGPHVARLSQRGRPAGRVRPVGSGAVPRRVGRPRAASSHRGAPVPARPTRGEALPAPPTASGDRTRRSQRRRPSGRVRRRCGGWRRLRRTAPRRPAGLRPPDRRGARRRRHHGTCRATDRCRATLVAVAPSARSRRQTTSGEMDA